MSDAEELARKERRRRLIERLNEKEKVIGPPRLEDASIEGRRISGAALTLGRGGSAPRPGELHLVVGVISRGMRDNLTHIAALEEGPGRREKRVRRIFRTRTQRTGTANKPVEYHTAVSEAISTSRSLSPYHLAIVVGFQSVVGSSVTTERLGRRSPLRRGLPICPRRRGGAGS